MVRIQILLFLGNPGERFQTTRHNLGFMCADMIAAREGIRWKRPAREYQYAEISLHGSHIVLLKPTTYMNLSGEALTALGRTRRFFPPDLLVICDDINLPLGRLRLRRSGSHGGHNGLRSIIDELGTEAFARLRLGVGSPPQGIDPAEFVLEPFSEAEVPVVVKMIEQAVRCIDMAVDTGVEKAMSVCNARSEESEND